MKVGTVALISSVLGCISASLFIIFLLVDNDPHKWVEALNRVVLSGGSAVGCTIMYVVFSALSSRRDKDASSGRKIAFGFAAVAMAELLIGPPIVMIVKSDRKPPEPVHVIENKIREGLYPLSGLLRKYPESSLPEYLYRQRLVTDAIQPYLYADEDGDLTKESPTRDTRVRKVETLLEPYEPDLIEIVRRSASQPVVQDPNVDLILYIHPSNRVSQVLREIATSPNTRPDRAAQAFNYLFMLRLDDATLRQQVIEIIASRGERTARAELGDILLQRAASDWGMEEMMPRYLDFLSIPFRPENYPTTNARVALLAQYCASATGLQSMEGEGIAYTALIEARVAEMNPAESDQANFIHQAKATLDILRKKRPANTLVNWKGQLLGISAKFGRRP